LTNLEELFSDEKKIASSDLDDRRLLKLEKLILAQSEEISRLSELVSKSLNPHSASASSPTTSLQREDQSIDIEIGADSDEFDFDAILRQAKTEQKRKKKPLKERRWVTYVIYVLLVVVLFGALQVYLSYLVTNKYAALSGKKETVHPQKEPSGALLLD